MRFANPEILMFLWLLPAYVVAEFLIIRFHQKRISRVIHGRLLPFLTATRSERKFRIKILLRVLSAAMMILAWARPQMGQSKMEIKSEGVELMLLVDVSDSMMAEDVRPNRLEQVKAELSKLVDALPGHKVGVIAFAGSASLLSPLTTDPGAIKLYLDSLSPTSVSAQGTVFLGALEEAKEAFQRGGVTADEVTKVTRVILMASDGEDHEPGALDFAKKLTNEGIRIFSLAYGTEKGAPIPERDSMGFLRGYKKDKSGQAIITTVKGNALKLLSQSGKGSFYHASYGGNHINKVIEDISRLEKAEFASEIAVQYDEKFQIFLLLGFLFLVLESLISDRKKGSQFWRGRYEVPQ